MYALLVLFSAGVREQASSNNCRLGVGNAAFDLRPLAHGTHDLQTTTTSGFNYRLNVCAPTETKCRDVPSPASKWRGDKCNNLGDARSQSVALLDIEDASKGVSITYRGGDACTIEIDGEEQVRQREIVFELHCTPESEAETLTRVLEESMCRYTAVIESKHACPLSPRSRMRWSMLRVVLVCGFLYLVVGYSMNKYGYGLQGIEAIPNVEFWRQALDVVAGSVLGVKSTVIGGGGVEPAEK